MMKFDERQFFLVTGKVLNSIQEKDEMISRLECLNEEMDVEANRLLNEFAWEQRTLIMESTADGRGFQREMKELERRRRDALADLKERYEQRLTELRERIDEMEKELNEEIRAYDGAETASEEGGEE